MMEQSDKASGEPINKEVKLVVNEEMH